MKPSELQNKNITLEKSAILDEVRKRSAYLANKYEKGGLESLPHDGQLLADFWRQACLDCVNICKPYVKQHGGASDVVDICDENQDFEITLEMPPHFGEEYLSAVAASLKEYAVLHILVSWLKYSGGIDLAEMFSKGYETITMYIRSLMSVRKPPVRIHVPEDLSNLNYI